MEQLQYMVTASWRLGLFVRHDLGSRCQASKSLFHLPMFPTRVAQSCTNSLLFYNIIYSFFINFGPIAPDLAVFVRHGHHMKLLLASMPIVSAPELLLFCHALPISIFSCCLHLPVHVLLSDSSSKMAGTGTALLQTVFSSSNGLLPPLPWETWSPCLAKPRTTPPIRKLGFTRSTRIS